MKILLAAVNAKYIHSNPAIYCLQSYAAKYRENIELAEFTINQNPDEILRMIYEKRPDVLAFSCYIWNITMTEQIIREYKKIDPNVQIWVGGPEVSYDAKQCMTRIPQLRGVMVGEGEQTFLELAEHYVESKGTLADVKGLCYRKEDQIEFTGYREPVDFRRLPFLYQFTHNLDEFENRIVYYETSRGCPFSCSYCLSSIDKSVRFRDLDLVYKELTLFLEKKVPQVKFIDRTFNCNKKHAMSILQFIKEHDNGITNFHFEIAADIMDQEELELLATLRPGLVQLEIGVQSTNDTTIHAINRRMDLSKVEANTEYVRRARNIHQHLDLIAGLPFEDYTSFGKSFNDVYAMEPDQLQLGFLKVLKGSYMEQMKEEYGIVYHSEPPYEVLYTNWLPYSDVLRLKDLEDMVEVYYNSGQFTYTMRFLTHVFESPFQMYEQLAKYYRENGLFGCNQARIARYYILLDFLNKKFGENSIHCAVAKQMMMLDLYLREKLKSRPEFAEDAADYKKSYKYFLTNRSDEFSIGDKVHIEHFSYDIFTAAKTGEIKEAQMYVVFDYSQAPNLFHECKVRVFDREEFLA